MTQWIMLDTYRLYRGICCLHRVFPNVRQLHQNADIAVEISHLLTYLLTPWSRAHLEKLTGLAASQEIPRIYGTRKFITVLTSVCVKEKDTKKEYSWKKKEGRNKKDGKKKAI
jgi:hypothetical protein